jgi:4-hydroxy-4-methyl-2-oxoglutarate aldolase
VSGIVVTDPPRAVRAVVDVLGGYGVATIHEAQGRSGLLGPHLRPRQRGVRVSGNAVTVSVPPGDNSTLAVAVEQCGDGDILVVTPTSACDMGYFGDLLATTLKVRGVRGLVIDAGVRDVADLNEMGFPVWSRAVSAEGCGKGKLGDVNVPISIAGRIVSPGDVVVADDDGVVVVPRGAAAAVVASAQAREDKEARARARYLAGEIALDVNEMRPMLERTGIRYVAHADWVKEQDA